MTPREKTYKNKTCN